jgi:hypothetical protein
MYRSALWHFLLRPRHVLDASWCMVQHCTYANVVYWCNRLQVVEVLEGVCAPPQGHLEMANDKTLRISKCSLKTL